MKTLGIILVALGLSACLGSGGVDVETETQSGRMEGDGDATDCGEYQCHGESFKCSVTPPNTCDECYGAIEEGEGPCDLQ